MSLYNDASLVMIPSGVKDGKLYSIKPDDGVGDFTFTRGSNLAATRVDENGLIEKGRENLLLQSNNFTTTWTTTNLTPTSGQSGYDGSSDAWLITSTASNGSIRQTTSFGVGVYSFSVYAKAGSYNWIRLYIDETPANDPTCYFDLLNGIVGTSANSINTEIINIGNGWYRCVVTGYASTNVTALIFPALGDNDTSGTGSVYIQDAQLELGLVATDYIETGATTEQAGILENLPRLDYTDSSCPSLLLEPTRTNLVLQSEYKSAGDFTNATFSYNSIISPRGVNDATKIIDNSTNGQHRVFIGSFPVTSGLGYTVSAFVKNNDVGFCYILLEGDFSQTRYYFNLSTGEAITSGLKVESFANGWYRIYVTQSAAATGTGTAYLNMAINGTSIAYSGTGQSLYFYGFQAEQGSYPTSYIPTYGTSVTRSGDLCVGAGDATTFNDSEGVLFVEMAALSDLNTTSRYISISDGTANNILRIIYASDGSLSILQTGSTVSSFVYFANPNLSENVKIAIKYGNSTSDYKVYINGVNKTLLSFTASPMTGLNSLDFSYPPSTSPFYGNIKKAIVFPTALTDSELAALTTI